MANSHELVNELSDEKRFKKYIGSSLNEVRYVPLTSTPALNHLYLGQCRNLVGDGLFTAHNEEPNWAIARMSTSPARVRNSCTHWWL